MLHMLRMVSAYKQVGRVVVLLVMINMVNLFGPDESAAKQRFRDHDVLKDIALRVRPGMRGDQ